MSAPLVDRIPFAKIFTILAIVLGVSLGLCGVTAVISTRSFGPDGLFGSFGILELLAILGSVAGLLLTTVVYVTLSVFSYFFEKVSQPSILAAEGDDKKIDGDE